MEWRPYPNECAEYRTACNQLLEAEDALRSQLERVAGLRRALPLGGEVPEDYAFDEGGRQGRARQVRLSGLFSSGLDSLLLYGFMYGPKMERAGPMCTSFLDSLDGAAPHLGQRIAVAVCARSPIDRSPTSPRAGAGRTCACSPPRRTATSTTI